MRTCGRQRCSPFNCLDCACCPPAEQPSVHGNLSGVRRDGQGGGAAEGWGRHQQPRPGQARADGADAHLAPGAPADDRPALHGWRRPQHRGRERVHRPALRRGVRAQEGPPRPRRPPNCACGCAPQHEAVRSTRTATPQNGVSPRHAIARCARSDPSRAVLPVQAVSYLLQHGADAKLKNDDNETPLDVALFKGRCVRACALSALSFQHSPPPPPRTKWSRRVPHSVLIGHAASLTPYPTGNGCTSL